MTEAPTRHASCRCGQLRAACVGEPVRVSVCHCLDCQRRSGSAFAAQARWPADAVTITGVSSRWSTPGEGGPSTFHFCPDCGGTVHYTSGSLPDLVAVPLGAFSDPLFPAPHFSIYENRKHAWVEITAPGIEHD